MRKPSADVKNAKSWGLFVLLGVLLAAVLALTTVFFLQARAARKEAGLREQILADLLGTLSALQEAETGQRGFLLTQEEIYLEPYRKGISSLHSQLDRLKSGAAEGHLPADTVTELELFVTRKLDELQRTIDLSQTLRGDEATALVKTGEGREAMEGLRNRTTLLAARQEEARERAQAREKGAAHYAAVVFIFVGVINLVLLAWLYLCLRRSSVLPD